MHVLLALLLWGNLTLYIANTHTPTHRWMGTSVMRREESKSKGLSNVQGEIKKKREEKKAVRWEGREKEKDGRLAQVSVDSPGTSDTSSPRLTLVEQLVLSQALHCLPQHFRPACSTGSHTQMRHTVGFVS